MQVLGDLGFSGAAARVALNRIIARGLLSPIKQGRFVHYAATPALLEAQAEARAQLAPLTEPIGWDGCWTLVWYSIPEPQRLQRARMGRWLAQRGFGPLQDNTWLAAGDSRDAVLAQAARLELLTHIIVLCGRLGDGLDIAAIAGRAWQLPELTALYSGFVDGFSPADTAPPADPQAAFVLRTRLVESFRMLAALDPRLPDDSLAIAWQRGAAVALYRRLQAKLLQPAKAYFATVCLQD